MIGGLIKSNRVAALAGAGFIAGALAVSPAQAADLKLLQLVKAIVKFL